MDEVVYVAVDSDGNGVRRDKARMGKTQLQRDALKATRAYLEQFQDRQQHKAFMKLEEMASPFDKTPNGVLMAAWYKHCIEECERYKWSMNRLILMFGDNVSRLHWLTSERKAEILKRPSPTNIPTVVKGAAHLHPVTKRRVADEVEQVFAEITRVLGVNVRRTVPNLESGKLLADDIAEHPDHTFDRWYEWFQQSQWRMDNKPVFANVAKIWESWPQAFESKKSDQATRLL